MLKTVGDWEKDKMEWELLPNQVKIKVKKL